MTSSFDHTGRHLDFSALHNARDLGGLPTLAGRETRRGALVRSEYLGHLDDAGRQALFDHGVRTIIDLRFARELAMSTHHYQLNPVGDINYINISICGEVGDPHYEVLQQVEAQNGSPDAWIEPQLDLGRGQIGRILQAIANAPAGGVLFHCYAGRDRTGLIAQLLLALVGVPDELIIEDYLLSNVRLAARSQPYLDAIEDAAERERVRQLSLIKAETAQRVLDVVQQNYGGVEAYLKSAGLSDAEIDTLRQRLLA